MAPGKFKFKSMKSKSGMTQQSILGFINPASSKEEKSAHKPTNTRDVPVAAVTPFSVGGDLVRLKQCGSVSQNGSIVATIDLTDEEISPPPPFKAKSLALSPKREKKNLETAWLDDLYGATPPSTSKPSPRKSSFKASPAKSNLFPKDSPWDDDDDDDFIEESFSAFSSKKPQPRKSLTPKSEPKTLSPENSIDVPEGFLEDDFPAADTEPDFDDLIEPDVTDNGAEFCGGVSLMEEDNFQEEMNFAGYRPSQSHLDEDDDDVGGWIPPHTPPRPELLQTCPMDLNAIPHKAVDDADNSTEEVETDEVPESQDIIDPSPVKPRPSRLSSIGRSRVSSSGPTRLSSSGSTRMSSSTESSKSTRLSTMSSSEPSKPPAVMTKSPSKPSTKQSTMSISTEAYRLSLVSAKLSEKSSRLSKESPTKMFKESPSKLSKESARLSTRLSIPSRPLQKDDKQELSPEDDDTIQRITPIVNKVYDLWEQIRKKASYNKAVSKMVEADVMKHEEWMLEFNNDFIRVFMLWNFSSGMRIPASIADKIEAAKKCSQRIKERLSDYENLEPPETKPSWETNPPSESRQSYANNPRLAYQPDLEDAQYPDYDDDSPPFDAPDSPIFSRSANGLSQGPSSSSTPHQISKPQVSLKPMSFTFKKPAGSVKDMSRPISDGYSDIENYCDNKTKAASFDFNNPRPGPSSTKPSAPYCQGTQFIEDFNTQQDLRGPINVDDEDDTIHYDKHLYATQQREQTSRRSSSFTTGGKAKADHDDINGEGKFIGEARNDGKDTLLSSEKHSFSREVRQVLTDKFGIKSYRPNQLQAVNSAMMGLDTFVLMPTGGGKSLCYQLPAAAQGGITVVISPLVSLIHDQVTKLNGMNISADHLSGDDRERHSRIYMQMRGRVPGPTLLYVTPEKVSSSNQLLDSLMSVYNQGLLTRFVIDEAHCVSQWGHDFRPDYKKLSLLRQKFPKVSMMALTATATPRVRTDILHQLKMTNPKWFLSSFNRSNLKYEVRLKKGKSVTKDIITLIKSSFVRQSGIVYCLSKRECEEVAKALSQEGISAKPYHAGLNPEVRSKTQDDWIQDKVRVVCATIAFGMGIDKPDVRFVLHQSLPKSIEGYYQESGRAGRDGEPSICIQFYCYPDMHRMRKLIEGGDGTWDTKKVHMDNLWQMVRYCENLTDCRRVLQLQYFGEVFDHNRCGEIANMRCDNCTRNMHTSIEKVDITETARQILLSVQRLSARSTGGRFTINHFVDIWRGAKNQKVITSKWDSDPLYGKGTDYSALEANRIIRVMVIEGYLWENLVVTKDNIANAYLSLGQKAQALLQGQARILHAMEGKKSLSTRAEEGDSKETDPKLMELQEGCFEELKHLVLETGREMNPSKHFKGVNEIVPLQALRQMSERLPTTEEALRKLEYMTKYRVDLYGEVILSITTEYYERRMQHLASQAQANQLAREEDAFQPGDELGQGWMAKGSGRGKSKYFNKRGGGGRGKRKGGGKRKWNNSQGGSTPKRRSVEGGGASWKAKGRGSSSGWSSSGASRGGGGASMGLPKRFGVNA